MTTNKEYITYTVHRLKLDVMDINLIIIDGEIDPDAPVDKKACKKAIYNKVSIIMSCQVKSLTEGGYSKEWYDNAKDWYDMFCLENRFKNKLRSTARFL